MQANGAICVEIFGPRFCTRMAKKVFVNGYGSIGKRIAAFISEDPEIDLIGVGKYSNDAGVSDAKSKGHNVYVPAWRL